MAFVPNFAVSQTVGAPSIITITDSSTGSDVLITQRRVYLQTSGGTFLVASGTTTDYTQWAIADASISINCLNVDYGLRVYVEWLNVSNVPLYDKTSYVGVTLYNETFDYGLTQNLAQNSALSTDNNFMSNKSLFRTYIDSGDQAISLNSDIYAAQLCYDKATEMRDNAQYLFNTNA